jgi:TonB family protein
LFEDRTIRPDKLFAIYLRISFRIFGMTTQLNGLNFKETPMRLFALTALALVPAAAFAQNAPTLQASVAKPVAFVTAAAPAPAATPAVAIASVASFRDVIKASLTSPELDESQAEAGALSFTLLGDEGSKSSFVAPKLIAAVGRKLPLDQATGTNADVTVNFIVDNHGVPQEFSVVRSAGSPAVDKSTVEALRQYRFKPATLNNLPIVAHLTMEIKLQK